VASDTVILKFSDRRQYQIQVFWFLRSVDLTETSEEGSAFETSVTVYESTMCTIHEDFDHRHDRLCNLISRHLSGSLFCGMQEVSCCLPFMTDVGRG
jgi:hypothetical protein